MHIKHFLCFDFKKLFLVLVLVEFFNFSANANPGDTTWVTVFNLKKLSHYGNYDTTAVFPVNKRFRKIRMHYILGRYSCAPGSQYCGSWDYTTQIYARPKLKDSVEIARIITPYASDWLSQNKKHDYIVEVTDYASDLKDTCAMRFNYSGYSWGFTITLKIEFIEGIPPMDALSVTKIYDGYFPYGNAANSIENYLVSKTFSYAATTGKAFIKNTVSGHGSDSLGCGEFCSKYYQLKINNNLVSQKQLWRSDCGLNQVYPQTGTWIYERANWCPGAVVWPLYHDLTGITTANSNFSVNVDMEPYTIPNPSGGFNWVSQLIKYAAPNHVTDVSIEDIVNPTKDDNYLRNNPACSNPTIKIKNVGTNTLTSVVFNYGLKGQAPLSFTWTGALKFLDTVAVVFPPSTAILSGSLSSVFQVSVTSVNGAAGDQNLFNNVYSSSTIPVQFYPKDFVIKMFTNNSTDPITNANESTWTLYDQNGSIIANRNNLSNATVYIDTITNLPPGCYKFSINDSGCDGLAWWANPSAGNGALRFDYINANNTIFGSPTDIGCNYTMFFIVQATPAPPVDTTKYTGLTKNHANQNRITIFPNPARQLAYIQFDLDQHQTVNYKLSDVNGKMILQKNKLKVLAAYETIDISGLNEGVYVLSVELEDHSIITKKLVIQK